MRRLLIAGLIALAVTGCAQRQAVNDITAACTRPDGTIKASCAVSHPQFKNLPQADQRAASYANMLYEQVDKKEITDAQAKFMYQEYVAKMQRDAEVVSNAQAAASSNAMMMTGAALIAAGQPRGGVIYPAPVQNYPRSTTCMSGYRSVTCSNF